MCFAFFQSASAGFDVIPGELAEGDVQVASAALASAFWPFFAAKGLCPAPRRRRASAAVAGVGQPNGGIAAQPHLPPLAHPSDRRRPSFSPQPC